MHTPEGRGSRDFQRAARIGGTPRDKSFRLFDVRQNGQDALVIALTGLGQRDLPCCALQEPGTEALFQTTKTLGNHRGERPRSRAAADMLPVATTRAKISISARLLLIMIV